ncbi:MAG: hypothetical protein E7310_05265 [Clostridiales bacterium]|nr:hypothetical protein [Clostridiales bacterium]
MKYGVILKDNEVEEILNMDLSFAERIKWFQNKYKIEELKDNLKAKFIFSLVQGSRISGDIQNNPENLKCPNCNGKYVVRTYAGDYYYRLIEGSKVQKENERKKLKEMGLYCNLWPILGDFTRDYLCLNCGIKWNKENANIYRDI